MINNMWYAALSSKDLPKGKLVGVKRFGEELAFWRKDNNEIACIVDKCCHRGASISKGKIVDGHAQCPFHGFEYDAKGKVKVIPANGKSHKVSEHYNVNAYRTSEKYGLIWVYYGDYLEDLPEIPFFEELKEGFNYSEIKDHWPMHYTRCIENQMDVVHVPFVHATTIGKGGKTVVYGPKAVWEDNTLTWYVKNVKDDGNTKAISADEMSDIDNLFSLQLMMPNIWQNIIGDKIRVFAAFSPIDEENTMIYLRFYQAFMPIWGLKHIIGFFGKIYSRIILRQDKRVVITQIPKASSLIMDEKLIPGDLPIIEFRKKREELIKK
ncbi:MAG TPA: aromatic ring-hydroxylating dioxygenase subunit alpha [Anaerovoracaceae bacterium]|nr:aromatic ring-hydroxylating dioxygenase subunit alpha [Anaerovoracaceae bacterium]